MRVLVNVLPSLGRKTGIGRYTAELIAALAPQLQPGETIDGFPDGWLRRACTWLRNGVKGGGGSDGGARSWRGWLKEKVVRLGRRFLDGRFAAALRRHSADLYH